MTLTGCYTTAGAALAAGVLARGTGLILTRAEAGAGRTETDAAALAEKKQDLTLLRKEADGQHCQVQAALSAPDAAQEYTLREIGLYAKEQGGTEVLYKLFRMDETLTVEPETDLTVTFYLTESILPGEAVAVTVNQQGLVTQTVCAAMAAQAKAEAVQSAAGALAAHAAAADAHSQLLAQKAPLSHTHGAGQDNEQYTTAQLRNIVLSTAEPSGGSNGQIWIQYS